MEVGTVAGKAMQSARQIGAQGGYRTMNGVRSPTDPSINGMLLITSFTRAR
jgi:hypothetical protein